MAEATAILGDLATMFDEALDPPWSFAPQSFLSRVLGSAALGLEVALTPTPAGDGTLSDPYLSRRLATMEGIRTAPGMLAEVHEPGLSVLLPEPDFVPQVGLMSPALPDLDAADVPPMPVPLPPIGAVGTGIGPAHKGPVSSVDVISEVYIHFEPRVMPPGVRQPVSIDGRPIRVGSRSFPDTSVSVRLRERPASDLRRRRRRDGKGVGWAVMRGFERAVTATFGRVTEVQDLVESLAWNAFDKSGRPAMLVVRERAFAGETIEKGDVFGAMRVNARSYGYVFSGIADGTFTVDLGGALVDYGRSQAQDVYYAAQGKAFQRASNMLGYNRPVGLDAIMRGAERQLGKEEQNNVSLPDEWFSAFSERWLWSRSRGVFFAP